MNTGRLQGKTVIVTGGAAGIGRATSVRFAAEGAKVVVCDINDRDGQETVELIGEANGEGFYNYLDVTDETQWKSTMKAVRSTYGRLDILINNAGLPYRRSLHDSSLQDWRRLTDVNAGGTFLGLKYGTDAIATSGGGAIVNISSAAALRGLPAMTSYAASKGAVRAMSRVAAMEFAAAGVRVNSVYPTSVRTGMIESDARDAGVSVDVFIEGAAALSPLGGIAEPHDIADAVLFLASDEARFITGAELVIDGGATAGFV